MYSRFKDFGIRDELLRAVDEAGYETPTPIQQQAIPILLEGHDLFGVSQTGTGKTVAFLVPILQNLGERTGDPQAVVVCPTRELAIQVAGEAERLGKYLGARTVLAYGGTSSGSQKQSLTDGCEILVATPGRLLDFLNSAWLSFRSLRYMVLDEADRMLDMGFINDVEAILRKAPLSRRTLLFSATIPDAVRELSEKYMFHPKTVRIGGAGTRVKDTVEHALYLVREDQKIDLLLAYLERHKPAKALVFTATRETTSTLAIRLRAGGHEVVSLSSLLSQANRERALSAFRRGEFHILVATDVASRGLDITDIELVVNFDVPMHPEDYVHRIGRTGRAHRSGKAITLVSPMDQRRVGEIERLLGYRVARETVEDFPYEPADHRRSGARRASSGRHRPGRGKSGTTRPGGSSSGRRRKRSSKNRKSGS